MALVDVELETLVCEPDALTTRPQSLKLSKKIGVRAGVKFFVVILW